MRLTFPVGSTLLGVVALLYAAVWTLDQRNYVSQRASAHSYMTITTGVGVFCTAVGAWWALLGATAANMAFLYYLLTADKEEA